MNLQSFLVIQVGVLICFMYYMMSRYGKIIFPTPEKKKIPPKYNHEFFIYNKKLINNKYLYKSDELVSFKEFLDYISNLNNLLLDYNTQIAIPFDQLEPLHEGLGERYLKKLLIILYIVDKYNLACSTQLVNDFKSTFEAVNVKQLPIKEKENLIDTLYKITTQYLAFHSIIMFYNEVSVKLIENRETGILNKINYKKVFRKYKSKRLPSEPIYNYFRRIFNYKVTWKELIEDISKLSLYVSDNVEKIFEDIPKELFNNNNNNSNIMLLISKE